jgi:hypothetical protein
MALKAAMHHRFSFLLGTLMIMQVVVPFVGVSWAADVAASAVFVFSVYAVSDSRRLLQVGLVLGAAAFLTSWAAYWASGKPLPITSALASLTLYGLVMVVTFRHVLKTVEVDFDTIAAALCVYLLGAFLWGELYFLLELLVPGSFSEAHSIGDAASPLHSARGEASRLTYFSIVTLSTLGYGDIVPLSSQARSLAALEAILGQVYLAVLVGRLVGAYSGRRRSARHRDA